MKILSIVGTRPNFIKLAPVHRALSRHEGVVSKIVHTGQHYDEALNDIFFRQLGLPEPNHQLDIRGATKEDQIAHIKARLEVVLEQERPDWVLVYGDVDSTVAGALVAKQLGIPVAHVEAGLRSRDDQMPEEVNRMLTDRHSDLLFATEQSAVDNLLAEGSPADCIYLVGNVMIDSLCQYREQASALSNVSGLGLAPATYLLMTMHRPSNVDNFEGLWQITRILEKVCAKMPVVFPLHPRTRQRAASYGLLEKWRQLPALQLLEPQGYLEFLNLLQHAFLVITDSGGVQDETTYLQVPCFTFRQTTERPVTVTLGTNRLFSDLDPDILEASFLKLLAGEKIKGAIPPLWDGHAADRIASVLINR